MTLPILDSRAGSGRAVAHEKLDDVVIRFAGDSGDGMQLTGSQFTNTSALLGNDLATFPDFPAEIRAPQGTLAGVSAFQVRIADYDIHTPGDAPDVLVAMNPAALKVNLKDLKPNGALIVNLDEFDERNLKKAGFDAQPARRRQPRRSTACSRSSSRRSRAGRSRTAGSTPSRRSAARTSSRSAWPTGSSAGRSRARSSGWRRSSPPSPSSPRRTSR